jgi:hypothetical protein
MGVNDPAYPMHGFNKGLTKRELIAAMAMQGLLGNASIVGYKASYAELFETLSEMAEKSADALIARLAADPVAEGANDGN